MYLARIDGTLVATRKHATLEGCRFLVAQRLEADGRPSGEPVVVLDRLGARRARPSSSPRTATRSAGCREHRPARLSVVGIVDEAVGSQAGAMRLGIVRGTSSSTRRAGAPRHAARDRGAGDGGEPGRGNGQGGGKALVVADHLDPATVRWSPSSRGARPRTPIPGKARSTRTAPSSSTRPTSGRRTRNGSSLDLASQERRGGQARDEDIDLSALRVVSAKDVEAAVREGATEVALGPRRSSPVRARRPAPARVRRARRRKAVAAPGAAPWPRPRHARLFASPEADAPRRRSWPPAAALAAAVRGRQRRQHSLRLGENAVLCTPRS